jgi:hypothetical protein
MKTNAKPAGTEITIVSRQMSPNSAFPEVVPPEFRSLADFVAAYKTTDKTISDLTGGFVKAVDVAKGKQDDIVPHLAFMQSLLSKKGSSHHLIIEAREKGHKIPWWRDYYEKYKDRLWGSLRTMERRIAAYRKDPSIGTTRPANGSGRPKHLTQLEHKLLGTATNVHEALPDIKAGHIDQAIKKLTHDLPTQDRIEEHLKRGVKPSHDNPDGDARVRVNNLEYRPGDTEPIEPSPASTGVGMPQSPTYRDWENHHLPALDFKLKYFADASSSFIDRYNCAFQGSAFKKLLALLNKPDQVHSNAQDFAQIASVLQGASENLNLLAAVITTALTSIPASKVELGDQEGNKKRPKGSASEDAGTGVRSPGVGL